MFQAPYNTVTYSVIGDDQAPNFFSLNPATGVISVAQSLFNDQASTYRLRIVASDGGNPTRVAYEVVTITVDRNSFEPSWVNPSAPFYTSFTQVLETLDFSTVLFSVSARDLDASAPYNEVTYDLIGNGTATTFFDVNPTSGDIRLRSSLLQDSVTRYSLLLTANDNGNPQRFAANTATVIIDVLRNFETPFFVGSPYAVTIPETTGIGVSIFTIPGQDNDVRNTFEVLRYSVIGDDAATVFFSIDTSSGFVRVIGDLQSTTDSVFTVRILAEDNGQPTPKSNTTTLTVTVARNLADPVFNPSFYQETILDTTALGTVITQVTATDADGNPPHNTVRYTYRGATNAAANLFFVNTITGEISLARALTSDPSTTSYELFVTAVDEGIPQRTSTIEATVRINVIRNENDPVFVDTPYAVSIPESQAIGSTIFTVTVFDADTTVSSFLRYCVKDCYEYFSLKLESDCES